MTIASPEFVEPMTQPNTASKKGLFWALLPVGLLGSMVSGLLFMAYLASRDPSFALEKDYYAKAVRYDEEVAQRGRNSALAWQLQASDVQSGTTRSQLVLRLNDAAGLPIADARLHVTALENARAAQQHAAKVAPLGDGSYSVELPARAIGIWELRVSAERGSDLFTQSLRVEFERSHDTRPGGVGRQ